MRTDRLILAGALCVFALGCSSGDQAPVSAIDVPEDEPVAAAEEAPLPGPPQIAVDGTVVGTLTQVDEEQGMFTLDDGAELWTFHFSDDTSITGDSPAQGLSGTAGNRVMVYYHDDEAADRWALLVEILGDASPDVP